MTSLQGILYVFILIICCMSFAYTVFKAVEYLASVLKTKLGKAFIVFFIIISCLVFIAFTFCLIVKFDGRFC